MASLISQTLDKVATIASGVSGVQAAWQGKKRFAATTTLENDIRALTPETQGEFWCYPGSRTAGPQTQTGQFAVEGRLLINLPTSTTTTTDAMIDFVESILQAVAQESQYTSISTRPVRSSWEFVNDDDGQDDDVKEVRFTFDFQLPPTAGA